MGTGRIVALLLALLAGAGCAGDGADAEPGPQRSGPETARGTARRDDRPFDARWIGAVVRRDHLLTPCQAELPRIRDGRFRVTVYGAGQAGCGGPGTEVRFWTYRDRQIFNDRWVPWSQLAAPLELAFSTADPEAAMPARTELSGGAFDRGGRPVPVGTRIEAHIDDTVCGVASVRSGDGFRGYIMNIVGPDSIPACRDGATITFTIGGAPAAQTAVNGRSEQRLFDLRAGDPA